MEEPRDPLGRLVREEARRVLSESQLRADPARIAEGWERRFVIEGARAPEWVSLYASLGYEVCAEPVRAEDVDDACVDCRLVVQLRFVTIYTRRPLRAADGGV